MNLLWLGDPQTFDAKLVGGKAANLSRLARLYYRVPDGFLIPAPVMKQVDSFELKDDIEQALSALMACHQLSEFVAAIRSSAVDEDGLMVSFAGQYASFLNITGADDILQAIMHCGESVISEHTQSYRHHHRLAKTPSKMAVLVQQLVVADVSVIAFSANPLTKKRDEILLNASWGLGESLVNGTVSPDLFVIRKSDLTIITRTISQKERMTVSVPGGTQEVNVPHFWQQEPSLTDVQIDQIAHLVLELEVTLKFPVDVECAYAKGELYLLQCRPITTIFL